MIVPVKIKLLVMAILMGLLHTRSQNTASLEDRPNIIFLLTDDQRWDALGVTGNQIIKTPHLDKLANDGILFNNAYVTTSICAVSRASILTGQYLSRHKINDFETGFSQKALATTYPLLLKKEGYTIGFIGKYGVGNTATHPINEFDFWACTDKEQPDYENIDENGNYIHYTDVVANNISAFLDRTDNRPFCLSVSFKAPHVQDGDLRQFIPNPRYAHHYEGIEIPVPKTADVNSWEAFPDFFRTDANIARERWKLRFNTPEKYQESVKNYYRLISGVDEVVGEMIQRLKDQGLDKNTVIIFMGDNGMFLGEHGLAGKWYAYEESIRVPLLIYDPREKGVHAARVEDIALNIDIAPTIMGLANIKIPESMQGIDLLRHVRNEVATRPFFFYEHTFFGSPKLPKVQGVISTSLKYTKYIEHNYEELFDLDKDPYEEHNLVNDSDYEVILNHQRKLYRTLKKKAR